MAFRPGGPGFSGNPGAGGAPPMMMFNPAQFSQPQAPQIPQPSPNPANQAQQANQSMSSNSIQDSRTGGFNSHQQFQQQPGQYLQQTPPDSTSNAYQNAGVYQNYSSGGQIPPQPNNDSSNWNYGQENMQNAQHFQQHQSVEQFSNSMHNSYQQNHENLYDNYNSQSGVTDNVPQKQAMYHNQSSSLAQSTLNAQGAQETLEVGAMPFVPGTNSVTGQPNITSNYTNDMPPQQIAQTSQNPTMEPSVSHVGTEHANFTNSSEFQMNSQNHSINPQMPPISSFKSASIDPIAKHDQNSNIFPETTENLSRQPPMWNPNDNVGYNQPTSALGNPPETNAGTGSKQTQPDLVSATSSSASPSALQQLPPDPYGSASYNSAASGEQLHSESLSTEKYSQIGSANHSISETNNGNGPFATDSSNWELQHAPSSLPPLYNPYQHSTDPHTTVMSKGGYGLGPDVITAVSSTNIPQVSSDQSQSVPNTAYDSTKAVENDSQGLSFGEEPQWESNVIADETNQATAKMASRIDEMRKAKEAATPQQLVSENSAHEPVNTLPTSSNIPPQGTENPSMHSNLPTYTDSSVDTSPEHVALQGQQGNVPLGSHAEHYAYYQQFENLSTNRVAASGDSQDNASSGPVYNRTPDVIAAQQTLQHPGAPPSSDRNLYMQTGHLNEQDDVLSNEGQAYHGEHSRQEPSNQHETFGQTGIHRPTTVPDGGNEMPVTTSSTARSTTSERHPIGSVPDTDIPLDRLVLGESGSASNQQLQANAQPPYSLQPVVSNPLASNWNNMWTNEQTNRVVTGEDDRRVPGAPSNSDMASLPTMQPHSVAQLQQPTSLPMTTHTEHQLPLDSPVVNVPNSVSNSLIEESTNAEVNQPAKQDLEVRREAVGSERRDESVMGPPAAPFNIIPLQANNQRNVPMGQDAPSSLQSTKIIPSASPNDLQKTRDNDVKNDTDSVSGNHGASSYKENNDRKNKHRSKKDEKTSEYRSGKGKSKKHGTSRRSSTPDDEDRESIRRRNRSPTSSFSSSSNDRSSDLSDSEERERDTRRYKGKSIGKERRGDRNKKDYDFNRSRHHNDSRRSDLDTSRDKAKRGDRNKRRSEAGGQKDYYRRADSSRYERDYRKGYSVNHHRNYRAGSYREREYDYYGGYSGDRSYYDSRPSSRGANSDYYPIYEDPNYAYQHAHNASFSQYMYPKMPAVEQQRNTLDPARLEAFRKNWEYYKMWSPQEQQILRQKDPAKYDNLMQYFQLYGHQLPASSMRPPLSSNNSIKSESGVKSPTAANPLATSQTMPSLNSIGNNSTIYPPVDPYVDPSNFQPTPNASTISDDKYGAYNTEIAGICDQISNLNCENPNQEGQFLRLTENESSNYPENDLYSTNQRLTPVKFSAPHVKAVFSARGILAIVDAKSPMDGQSATIEVHSLKSVLNVMPEYKDLSVFPGPLIAGKTHKGEVIQFCQNKIQDAKRKEGTKDDIVDRSSYILLWELLILLLRQKSAIDGCDIAELLLKDRGDFHKPYAMDSPTSLHTKKNSYKTNLLSEDKDEISNHSYQSSEGEVESKTEKVKDERSLIVKTGDNRALDDVETHVMKFRDYLVFGHKREGLEYAMQHGLWGHALFLASKMDERSYSNVMLRFANGLVVNDPLQTLYQLMSGRQPIAVKECADSAWGDWRPHLAMILSNSKNSKDDLSIRSIKTLGDTLHEKGFLYAGQFCYLMAEMDFCSYENKSSKLVLIGGDRSQSFEAFPTNEAIQATEIYEYAQKLSNPEEMIPTLQYYKYLKAVRLIDYGLCNDALDYLKEVAAHILKRPEDVLADNGVSYAVFLKNVLMLSEQLKYIDPSYLLRDGEVTDMSDPEWLVEFRSYVENAMNSSSYDNRYYSGNDAVAYTESSLNAQGPSTVTENTEQYIDSVHRYNDDAMMTQYGQFENNANYDYQEQPTNAVSDGISMYNPQTAYRSSFDQPLQQPLTTTENKEQNSPFFMNTATTNHNLQPSISPEASDLIGYPSAGGSAQESPVHYHNPIQDFEQERTLEKSHAPETTTNYFTKTNFQPDTSSPDSKKITENGPSSVTKKPETPKPKEKDANDGKSKGTGLFGWVKGKLGVKDDQVHMGDKLSLYYDENLKRWVDPNADPNEDDGHNTKPPPTDMQLMGGMNSNKPILNNSNSLSDMSNGPPPPSGGNKYSAGGITKRRGVVDVLKNSQPPSNGPSSSNNPPLMAPPMMAPASNNLAPTNFMVPGIGTGGDIAQSNEAPPELDNHADDNTSNPQSNAPLMFFNPSQFSNQAISTPDM